MEKEKKPDLSRRNFGKVVAGLGAAATIAPFSSSHIEAAEKSAQEIRKKYATLGNNSPIVVDPNVIKPFKKTDTAFFNPNTMIRKDKDGNFAHWSKAYSENRKDIFDSSKYSTEIPAPSVTAARSALALAVGAWTITSIVGKDFENRKLMKWTPMTLNTWGPEVMGPPLEKDPNTLTHQTKFAARLAGADLVGIAPLNKNWMYSETLTLKMGLDSPKGPQDLVTKPIVFKDVEQPIETENELIVPNSVNNVVVAAVAQNREMVQAAPTAMATAATGVGYSRMSFFDLSLCEFIRAMGYIAIPCSNGVGQSVPMAIEAGLGEGSRMGLLVTPEYGPNVRLTKVLTNMPLNYDKPIDFGVKKFCDTCKKCARECPSKSITEGTQSFQPRNIHNQAGKLQWQNDYAKCHDYWVENGTSCSICIAVCPFTKGDIWIHDGVEWAIKNASFLDPIMLGMDDAMGYGETRDVQDVWDGPINTYGLDTDHFQDTKKSYGGKS